MWITREADPVRAVESVGSGGRAAVRLGHQDQGFMRPEHELQNRSTDLTQRSSNRDDEMMAKHSGVSQRDGKIDRPIEIVQGLEEMDRAALALQELDQLPCGRVPTPAHLLEDVPYGLGRSE